MPINEGNISQSGRAAGSTRGASFGTDSKPEKKGFREAMKNIADAAVAVSLPGVKRYEEYEPSGWDEDPWATMPYDDSGYTYWDYLKDQGNQKRPNQEVVDALNAYSWGPKLSQDELDQIVKDVTDYVSNNVAFPSGPWWNRGRSIDERFQEEVERRARELRPQVRYRSIYDEPIPF